MTETLSSLRVTAADAALTLRSWWRSQPHLRIDAPRVFWLALVLLYFLWFYQRVWFRHEFFGSFDYDLGMYDQGIWQLSRGRGFMTIRGMHVFGHHANIGYLLLVPFYWLGAGPHFLNFLNTLWVVGVAVPLYLLCKTHMKSEWAGFWITVAYLGHFVPQWMIKETFHAESLAAPFLVGAIYCASVKNWRWFAFCVVAAIIWKEDVALAIAMLGVAVGVAFWEPKKGALTAAFGLVWFFAATKFLMAPLSPDAVFDTLFGDLGRNAGEVVKNSLLHPSMLGDALEHSEAGPRAVDMLRPYGFVSLLSPDILLFGLPQYVINFATTVNFTWDLRHHYNMLPFTAVIASATHTAVRVKKAGIAWLIIVVMVTGVVWDHESGVGPWAENSRIGHWPLTDAPNGDVYRAALEEIDGDSAVSTMYYLVPHLSHREHIYTFPNPWVESNYGVRGDPAPPDPTIIDQLLLDTERLNASDVVLYERIVEDGELSIVWQRGTVVLLE